MQEMDFSRMRVKYYLNKMPGKNDYFIFIGYQEIL